MLRLILLRHAKAVAHDPSADRGRRLAERGRRDAERVGHYLADEDWLPQLALVSPAARTRETFEQLVRAFEKPIDVTFVEALYEAEPADLLQAVAGVPAEVTTLIVIGHNPGIAEFARSLASSGGRKGLRDMAGRFPTGALAVIQFAGDAWSALEPGAGRLEAFTTPAALGGDADLD